MATIKVERMSVIIMRILAKPSQNSVSPKLFTWRICVESAYVNWEQSSCLRMPTLTKTMAVPNTVIQIATFKSGLQY